MYPNPAAPFAACSNRPTNVAVTLYSAHLLHAEPSFGLNFLSRDSRSLRNSRSFLNVTPADSASIPDSHIKTEQVSSFSRIVCDPLCTTARTSTNLPWNRSGAALSSHNVVRRGASVVFEAPSPAARRAAPASKQMPAIARTL